MRFAVLLHDDFAPEFRALNLPVKLAIARGIEALAVRGPQLGRPWVDTLKGSRHANMKELRVTSDKMDRRIAFAFDPERNAILLAGVAKGGVKDVRTFARLVAVADARLSTHVAGLRS